MEIQSVTLPLANQGSAAGSRVQSSEQWSRAESDRPVEASQQEGRPRSSSQAPNRGTTIDIEV